MFEKLDPIKGMRKTRETTFIVPTFESFPPRNWFDRKEALSLSGWPFFFSDLINEPVAQFGSSKLDSWQTEKYPGDGEEERREKKPCGCLARREFVMMHFGWIRFPSSSFRDPLSSSPLPRTPSLPVRGVWTKISNQKRRAPAMESIYGRPKVNFRVVSKFVESSWNMELTEARGHDIQSWKRYVPSFHHHHQPPPSPTGRRPTFTAVRWNFHGPDIYSTPLHRFSIFSPLQLRFFPGFAT